MIKDLIPHDLVEEGAVITVEAPDALANNHKKAPQADVSYVTPVTNGTTEVKKAKAKIEVTCFNAEGTEISYNTPVNAGEEITYIATIKGEEDEKKLEDLRKSLKWMFWVGDKTLPKSQKYIAIARDKAGTESKTDIMQEKDPGKLYASLQQYGYISSSWGKGNKSKEGKNSTCELKIVFSKWLETLERVRVEAYIGIPERTSNSSAVCSRVVKAKPEIIEGYWVNAEGQKISTAGYDQDIYLYLKTLGLNGKVLETEIYDSDLFARYPENIDDYIEWKNNKIKIENREAIKQFKVGPKTDPRYADAQHNEKEEEFDILASYFDFENKKTYDLELFFSIINHASLNLLNPNPSYGYLTLTPKEKIVDAFFARTQEVKVQADAAEEPIYYTDKKTGKKKKSGKTRLPETTVPCYEKLDNGVIGQKVQLVAECTNLEGKEVTFKIYEKEPLLVKKDAALPVLQNEAEVTEIKATVKEGFAVAEVELWKGDGNEGELKKWKSILHKDQNTYITDKLFIKVKCNGREFTLTKDFLKNNLFNFEACKWHDPLETMAYRGWYGPGSTRWEPESSAYLKKTDARLSGKHEGIDLYAPIGTITYACVDGGIYLNYFSGTYGNCLGIKSIYYGRLLYFFYAHLNKKPTFKLGEKVKAGDPIGETGVSGNANKNDSKKNHLHFEVRNTHKKIGGRISPLETIPELKENLDMNPNEESQN